MNKKRYYYTQKQNSLPEETKQKIVLGVNLDDVNWNSPKQKSHYIGDEEISVLCSGDGRSQMNFRTKFIDKGERVMFAVVGDKIIIRKAQEGYIVSEMDSKLKRFAFKFVDELKPFIKKKYPLHKYDDETFF